MSKTLTLNLKGEYFDQIKSGEKIYEYREVKPFWEKRLEGRDYDRLVICKGYPKKGDTENRIDLPYRGYVKQVINHPHFGEKPVNVFAIRVTDGPF